MGATVSKKVATKEEEVNLLYIQADGKLVSALQNDGVEYNVATKRAILEIDKPEYACWYAVFVEKKPCEETREVSCREPYFAWTYALYVDGTPHPKTREGVRADPYWRGKYRIWESGFGVDWRKNGCCL